MGERRPEPMAEFFDARADGYDDHMRESIEGLEAIYEAVGAAIPRTDEPIEILDLGIGTGLELASVFARAPNARITGIDVSAEMLSRLCSKFSNRLRQLRLIEGSFMDIDLGCSAYDLVVSVMALHHWLPKDKLLLYRRVHDALGLGGRFVSGDYVETAEEFARLIDECRARGGPGPELHHIDLPLAIPEETSLLEAAGFVEVRVTYQASRAAVFVACRAMG